MDQDNTPLHNDTPPQESSEESMPETGLIAPTDEPTTDAAAEDGGTGARDNQSDSQGKGTLAEPLRILEAVLFAADDILTIEKLKSVLPGQPDARKIRHMTESINAHLQKQRHPFEIVEIGGGYQFRTVSYYYPWVQQLFKEKAAKKLSIQSLECLAIIAYKQPITKAEIEALRGVMSDGAMKTLLEKHLVTVSGRSDKAGRPLLYATTKEFLTYFGLNKLADLPKIEEFEALAKEKLGELSDSELHSIETEKGAEAPEPEAATGDAAPPA